MTEARELLIEVGITRIKVKLDSVIMVMKKYGNLCFCVDYESLNAVTMREAYPLPQIKESLAATRQATFFSILVRA